MKTWVRKSLKVGVLSAGIILFAGGAAQADTSDNDGALTGNQILADIDVPINVCGNAIGVLGDAEAACSITGGSGGSGGTDELTTSDNSGLGNGNQVDVPVEIPINICGNAIGVLGDAAAACQIGDDDGGSSGYDAPGARNENGTLETGDNGGLLTGNQILADIDIPIIACGNAISVAGDSAAACAITSHGGGESEGLGAWNTGGSHGLLTGNQILADLDVPITVCGNAIGILGNASAACSIGGGEEPGEEPEEPGEEPEEPEEPGEEPEEPEEPGEEPEEPGTGGDYGDESRRGAAESLPVFNSIKGLTQLTDLLPVGQGVARQENGSTWTTGDNHGLLTGNQIGLDVDIPIHVVGNAVAVAGDAVGVVR
jgi:hypothetical protein